MTRNILLTILIIYLGMIFARILPQVPDMIGVARLFGCCTCKRVQKNENNNSYKLHI